MSVRDKVLKFNDAMNHRDEFLIANNTGLRGHVIMGHDLYVDNNGISQLGEVLFESDNHILLGGSNYIIDKIFGITGGLQIDTLNKIINEGSGGGELGNSGEVITDINHKNNIVCLFNVGIGGCGAAYTDIKEVRQQDRVVERWIPFRVVDEPLTGQDADKYFFKKTTGDGKIAYYLKAFEAVPERKNLWKDAGDDEDGSPVTSNPHTSNKTDPIETFAECVLKITSEDLREYFSLYDGITSGRFNSLGLCTGVKSTLADGSTEYKLVKQFSLLSFSNEMLHMNKDLTILYRIYNS